MYTNPALSSNRRLRRPPGIARFARPVWAPSLITIYVGPDALNHLTQECVEQRRYGIAHPVLALPGATDPMGFNWPVRGQNVRILGQLDRADLLDLMHALMRNGAATVAGPDDTGKLYIAVNGNDNDDRSC